MIHTKTQHSEKFNKQNTVHTTDVTGKSWVVANNTDFEIVVISASAAGDGDTTELYKQTLQTLAASDGRKSIAKGGSAIVALADGQEINNLIIARASTLSPLKVLDAPDDGATMPLSVPVTSADVSAAGQAEKFQQTIVAFPSADLATAYAAALDNDDPDAINKFFPAQKGYEQVTINLAVAFQTYYERFPFVYAAYENSHNYYLYSSDGTANTYVGSVQLENNNKSPLDTADALGKFKARFTNSLETLETTLSWADGQFTDDADTPTICLRGLFVQRSRLTGDDSDTALMALLGGTVNGQDLLVYDKQIHKDKNGQYSDLDALLHPDSAKDYAILVAAGLLALAGLVVLAIVGKKIVDRLRKGLKTPEELRAEKLELIAKNRAEVERIGKRTRSNFELPADLTRPLTGLKKQISDWLVNEQRLKFNDIIDKQQTYHDHLLDKTNNPKEMQKVQDNLEHIVENTFSVSNDKFMEIMKDMMSIVAENNKILNKTYDATKAKLDSEAKTTISEAKQTIEWSTKKIATNESDRERIADDTVPDIDIVEVE